MIIIVDLPGVEEDAISLEIPNPGTLEIRVNAKVRKRENLKGTYPGACV